jgi:hypothetical protein
MQEEKTVCVESGIFPYNFFTNLSKIFYAGELQYKQDKLSYTVPWNEIRQSR